LEESVKGYEFRRLWTGFLRGRWTLRMLACRFR
jgi:hypothetical protein